MKKLRKEIRKLEKLECIRLNKALGGKPENDAVLLRQILENQSSFDSLTTDELPDNGNTQISHSLSKTDSTKKIEAKRSQIGRSSLASEIKRYNTSNVSAPIVGK